ncbi:MAG TPA: GntR family transcriptional regulator [Phycisphaerae bacterium]|nr:GntR family transcriptional regulator [Phycisphaerae bacterium]
MTRSQGQPKYVRIQQALLQEISGLQPGSRVPGVTALAERFGVARATAERVLNELARQGYVRQVPGSGTFVADRHIKKVAVLSYELPSEEGRFYTQVGRALTEELQNQGHNVHLLRRTEQAAHGPDLQQVRDARADAFATLGIMSAPYLEELARLSRALVAVDYRPMSLRVDSVTVASMRSAYLATRALLVAARRRLCYLGVRRGAGYEEADTFAQRMGFERAHSEAGLDVPQYRIVVAPYFEQVDAVRAHLEGPEACDGVVCFDEEAGSQLCATLRNMGRNVPADVAVIACGGQGRLVSEFLVDPAEMGRVAGKMLSERLSFPDQPPHDYELWPRYHDGGTVPPEADAYIRSVMK